MQSITHSLSVLPQLKDLCHVCLAQGQSTIITYAQNCSQIAQMVVGSYESQLARSPIIQGVNFICVPAHQDLSENNNMDLPINAS